jgi:DNA-binding MarR family transcriptional regulator
MHHVLDLMERDLAEVYAEMGLRGFRLRYTPVVRALDRLGPSSIRALAEAIGVTHSAASQTVGQMRRDGFVEVEPDADDGRARVVRLTARAEELVPALDAEWDATERAVRELEDELSYPFRALLDELAAALDRRSLRDRIGEIEW